LAPDTASVKPTVTDALFSKLSERLQQAIFVSPTLVIISLLPAEEDDSNVPLLCAPTKTSSNFTSTSVVSAAAVPQTIAHSNANPIRSTRFIPTIILPKQPFSRLDKNNGFYRQGNSLFVVYSNPFGTLVQIVSSLGYYTK
jgi:hypothetical protein